MIWSECLFFPKCICWKPTPHGDEIRSWGPSEAIRSGESSSLRSVLRWDIPRSSLTLSAKCGYNEEVCDLKEDPLLTMMALWYKTFSSQNGWDKHFCCLWASQSVMFCYGNPGGLIHIHFCMCTMHQRRNYKRIKKCKWNEIMTY